MTLAYGNLLTIDKALELGVFDAADALASQGPDKPMKVVTPSDHPVTPESQPVHHAVSIYRALHHLRHGGLHRALRIPEGQSIPQDTLELAKRSKNAHVSQMATLASLLNG